MKEETILPLQRTAAWPSCSNRLASSNDKTMPNPFQSLYAAILDDDGAKVNRLLDKDPVLANRGLAEEDRYESRIAHWAR